MSSNLNRRSAIKGILAGATALSIPDSFSALAMPKNENVGQNRLKGNINHSVSRWCFDSLDLETLCQEAKKIGITGIDLVGPKSWPTLKKYDLESSMCNGAEINLVDGFNDTQFHEKLIKNYSEMIPVVAKAGYKNLICFSGNKRGKSDEEGWNNCVNGLKRHGLVYLMHIQKASFLLCIMVVVRII
ncbi:MAG: hydroxypyruvate isomerase, partial [Flavobacterium sp.]